MMISPIIKRTRWPFALSVVPACMMINAGNANAVLVFEFIQNGSNVDLKISGSLKGLPAGFNSSTSRTPQVEARVGRIVTGRLSGTGYSLSGDPSNFGTGLQIAMTSYSGDLISFARSVRSITLPSTYTQGTPITGTGLFTGQTLAGLGLSSTTPGLLGSWTVGTDTVQVRVGAQPSPAAAPGPLPLLGAGAAFAASRRLRARLNAGPSSPLA